MVGHCLDCRWWEPHEEWRRTAGFGDCVLSLSENGEPDHAGTLAWAEDAESYQAGLVTSPVFGCVQWEEKG